MGHIKKIRVDLHMHSIYSDGTMAPNQLVLENSLIGNEAISLTDHDSISGLLQFRYMADRLGVEAIDGVEISTSLYHILGYFFDPDDRDIKSLVKHAAAVQNVITELRVEKIKKAGIPISYQKVCDYQPMARLGKANIVNAMLLDTECRDYFRKEYGRMLNGREIFNLYLAKGAPGGKVKGPKPPRARDAIEIIHDAGGIAVVAHPFKDANSPADLHTLVEEGLDGIECQPNFGDKNIPFIEYAKECSLLVTYGSDFHGPFFPRSLLMNNGNMLEKFW